MFGAFSSRQVAAVNILEEFGSVVSILQLCALAWPHNAEDEDSMLTSFQSIWIEHKSLFKSLSSITAVSIYYSKVHARVCLRRCSPPEQYYMNEIESKCNVLK